MSRSDDTPKYHCFKYSVCFWYWKAKLLQATSEINSLILSH